jgi:hypothetical protein
VGGEMTQTLYAHMNKKKKQPKKKKSALKSSLSYTNDREAVTQIAAKAFKILQRLKPTKS